MSFEDLGLMAELLSAVAAEGYTNPTPIQEKSIPLILEGRDVLAGAQTGTGKTAAFTLPMLQSLTKGDYSTQKGRLPRALVLTPTRELAAQVGESVDTYGRNLRLRSTIIYGGVGINPQIASLRRGVDIVVGTPGRLLDHAGQGTLKLSHIEILVLDEADRMLDMGFIHDIKRILKLIPRERQNLLFSATYSDDIKRLADGLLHNPEMIQVARSNAAVETVTQVMHPVGQTRKRALLSHLIQDGNWNRVLIFTRTKHGANRLSKQLTTDGITSTAIHGNKSQAARTKALSDFKKGKVRALVATDIAARGLDIDMLPHVVNFDLPNVPEDYIHRIGRTGRAGETGIAVSLVSNDERGLLSGIERILKKKIDREIIPGYSLEDPKSQKVDPRQESGRHGEPRKTGGFRKGRPSTKSRSEGSSNRGARSRRG